MSEPDQHAAGLFNSLFTIKKDSKTFNDYYANIDEKNTYHYNTNLHLNSSQSNILSLSGSNNQGTIIDKARITTTNVFERSIFFNLTRNPTLLYLFFILFFFLFLIFVTIGLFIYYRKKQPRRRRPTKQKQELSFRHMDNNGHCKINQNQNMHRLSKYMMSSKLQQIFKHHEQNRMKSLEQEEKLQQINKNEIKNENKQEDLNRIPTNNRIALEEQDNIYINMLPTNLNQDSVYMNIYDTPPALSMTQWAYEQIQKYMKP